MEKLAIGICLGVAFSSSLSLAETRSDPSLESEAILSRMNDLETQLENWKAKSEAAQSPDHAGWVERITIKGDLRYRHEMIKAEGSETRNRSRVRARVGISAEVNPNINVVLQLASGSDDPVSTNQTLGGGFSSKPVQIDLAYFDWSPNGASTLHVRGGKMKNPFGKPGKTELIWDGDLNPEGGAVSYASQGENLSVFANLGGFWIVERGKDADTGLFGAQAGAKIALPFLGTNGRLTFGASYYDYGNVKNREPTFDSGDSFGNAVDADGNIAHDYDLFEVFAELGFALGKTPISIFGDFVNNTSAGVQRSQGWLAGATLGKCKQPHSWALRYNYRTIESDAVMGVFADSDFRGGGADGKGHEVGLDYQLAKNWKGSVSYFHNQRDLSFEETDYQRLQIDLAYKFK